ncbi:hypothetical protein [Owenweeksia hongkongensis]|nr:hypothetical protein [Owenweeksia hongkongensis]
MARTLSAQECDSVYAFSNFDESGCSFWYQDELFVMASVDSAVCSFYDFYGYRDNTFFNLVVKNDSIVSGSFSLVVYEMTYDSAHAHLARNKHDKYGLCADTPTIVNRLLSSKDLRKLNSNIDLNRLSKEFVKGTTLVDSNKVYFVDGVEVRPNFGLCNNLFTFHNSCVEIMLAMRTIPNDSSNVYGNLVRAVDESISFKKKQKKIIKELPFKYYSLDGGGYYSWKKGPLGKLKYWFIEKLF